MSLIAPYPPLDAYRRDLEQRPDAGGRAFGERDGQWLALASILHQIAALPAPERTRHAERAAPQLRLLAREIAGDGAPPGADDTLSELVRACAVHMEDAGALHLAYSTLVALHDALPELGERERGFVLVRQARVARQLGGLETANGLYKRVARLGTRIGDREIAARAWVGLGILASYRGNFPESRRFYIRVLKAAKTLGPTDLLGLAHHGLLFAASAAGDFEAALVHGWAAFQGAGSDPDRQADMLLNLARVANDAGHHRAALRAYLAALSRTSLHRLRVPASEGAVVAAARLGRRDLVGPLTDVALRELAVAMHPYERAMAWIALAEAHALIGMRITSAEYRERAVALAREASFHEVLHLADTLDERVVAFASAKSPRRLRGPAPRAVLRSMEELPDDEGRLVGAVSRGEYYSRSGSTTADRR